MSELDDDNRSRKPRLKRDKDGFLREVDLTYEFDCPSCSATNPVEDGFKDGSEVQCSYCGEEFKVIAVDERRFKFRSVS